MVYFDNGATTLKPDCVKKKIDEYYNVYTSSIHRGDYKNSLKVSDMYEEGRKVVANFLGAKHPSEIVFTSGTTDSLNKIVFGYFRHQLKSGDEVLITETEHASNVLPWFILAKEMGIVVKYIPLNENNEVTLNNLRETISNKTKVVSIAHITNVIGDIRDIKNITSSYENRC